MDRPKALSNRITRLWRGISSKMRPPVFFGAAGVVVAFVTFGSVFTSKAAAWFPKLQDAIASNFGWVYVATATGLLVVCGYLLLSRHGRVVLGNDEAEPEFSYPAWFAMLFSAGMGTGLVFWSVAEPLSHSTSQLVASSDRTVAVESMKLTFFHWGLHAWAIYCILGLGLAFFHFRKDKRLAPSSVLYPILGDRVDGPIGQAVDVLCTVGTLFGVATSLGLGALQINAGLASVMPLARSATVQIGLIALITLAATISVVLGLERGVQRLSKLNLILAGLLLLFVAIVGPTLRQFEVGMSALGAYLGDLGELSFDMRADAHSKWHADWTLFYWAWWISWSPFVATFVARVSKGRTVREFVLTVLCLPTLVTFLWLSVFGTTALEMTDAGDLAPQTGQDAAKALHSLLSTLPLEGVTGAFATLVVIVFFITSSDSGSLVDDMVTSGDPDPPWPQRVFWAVSEGAVAAVLLVAGGLEALRSAALCSGLPMAVLLVISAYSLLRGLSAESRSQRS